MDSAKVASFTYGSAQVAAQYLKPLVMQARGLLKGSLGMISNGCAEASCLVSFSWRKGPSQGGQQWSHHSQEWLRLQSSHVDVPPCVMLQIALGNSSLRGGCKCIAQIIVLSWRCFEHQPRARYQSISGDVHLAAACIQLDRLERQMRDTPQIQSASTGYEDGGS